MRILRFCMFLWIACSSAMDQKDILRTERLLIRRFNVDDLASLTALFTDPDVMKFSKPRRTLSLKEIEDLLQEKILQEYNAHGFGRYAVIKKDDGAFIGYAGISKQNVLNLGTVIDLGYAFHKNYWGKGYATETAQALVEHARNLNIPELVAFVSKENAASQNVVLKSGFRPSSDLPLNGIPHTLYKITLKQ